MVCPVSRKPKPRAEVWTRERCFITELVNCAEQPEVSLARARVEAGVTTELHSLSASEWYIVEAGEGLMRVADREPFVVRPGDAICVEKNAAQQITNNGDFDLIFLCVCVPRFSQECYTSLE
jgi:mannose-6-phosphate isomerase-like protein (cupin superfamily)